MKSIYKLAIGVGISLCVPWLAGFDVVGQEEMYSTAQDMEQDDDQLLTERGMAAIEDGQFAEAERLLKRALAIQEKASGPEHLYTADRLDDLAKLYKVQENYAVAERLLKRALAIREKALGAEDMGTAKSLYNLAELYHFQEKYAAAEPLYKRALAIQQKQLLQKQLL
jgi:tetratricopeptide (TPR) repeat protein